MYYDHIASPIGRILLAGDGEALTFIGLPESRHPFAVPPDWRRDAARFDDARHQFDAWFAGTRRQFDLELAPRGTPFQRRVWDALTTIPYGETISYAELARRIGQPTASRAVGLANGANPLSIIVPCHRVIGANGSLTGYGGGLAAKRFLLEHERRHAAAPLLRMQESA
ncbi:MAG: methylated-DNA--[protein]-cysteine S-methyltransferase [Xanthomonadales bacterium]|nr:methylated-DNA--[protein]-cysteine S-methyltransferase [Xanthomonadales bacterium]